MSSTNKFPSGLNNWLDSDRPERLDFVTDNEIIDQNALWKNDYDAEGIVAQRGGIDSYAMAKDEYDPAGIISAAGGIPNAIQSAVAAKEGFSTYIHSKSGTVHSLTNTSGGDVIRFVAMADFNNGDTFTVNEVVCTAQTTDGEELYDGYFVQGAAVTCCKNGNIINFKTGGAGQNFNVLAVADYDFLPSNPIENTVAVISSISLPTTGKLYSISTIAPLGITSLPTGTVWIQTDNTGPITFDMLKRSKGSVWISPVKAWQYDGNAWNGIAGYIYKNNMWNQFSFTRLVIYDRGNEVFNIGALTKVFSTGQSAGNALTIASGKITQSSQQQSGIAGGSRGDYGNVQINLSNYTTLTINVAALVGTPVEHRIGFLNSLTQDYSTNSRREFKDWAAYEKFTTTGELTIDVRSLDGPYYFALSTQTNSTTITSYSLSSIVLS